MELHWKNLTLNEDWLQVRLCLSFCWFLFTARRKRAGSGIICLWHRVPWVSSLSSQPGDLCFPQLRWCCTEGLGGFVPLLLCVTCCCCLPAACAQREHHFPHSAVPSQLEGAPALRFHLNRAQQLRLNRAQLRPWHICKVWHEWRCSQIPARSQHPTSARVRLRQCRFVCCTSCSGFHRGTLESWEQGTVSLQSVSRQQTARAPQGSLCPLPDGSGWNEHPFLTALNPSCHGQHPQWAPQRYEVVSCSLSSSAPGPLCFPSLFWLQVNKEYEIQYETKGALAGITLGRNSLKQEVLLS